MGSKMSRHLAETAAHQSEEDNLDVVVELAPVAEDPTGGRAARIAVLRRAFDEDAKSLRALIAEAGGEIVDEAWINRTLRLRIPKRAIARLEADEHVASVDAPRSIEPDGSDNAAG